MKFLYVICLLTLLAGNGPAAAQPQKRIVLLGGAGDNAAVLTAIGRHVPLDSNTTLLFLGNNTTAADIAGERWGRLDAQLGALGAAQAIFLPGTAEWNNGRRKGIKRRKAEERYLRSRQIPGLRYLPENACSGVETVPVGKDAVLVIMDSQWWLQRYDKPGIESDCKYKTEQQVLDEIKDLVADHRGKLLIFATHHPFRSTGLQSGYFGLKQHLFPLTDLKGLNNFYLPLPVVGSLYPIARNLAASRQEAPGEAYQDMVRQVEAMLAPHPFAIRVAGHEQHLELYEEEGRFYITSGAGSEGRRVSKTAHTPYAAAVPGFSVINLEEGKATVEFYEVHGDSSHRAYSRLLHDYRARPAMEAAVPASASAASGDSVTAAVYAGFAQPSGLRRLVLGDNNRAAWAAPVRLKVFRLHEENGGMEILGMGGGNQTTSVKLRDAGGREWSLRTIVKDPAKVMPAEFQQTVAEDVMFDLMSASHPYAALPAGALARTAGMAAPEIRYYYVPDDTALGVYRPAFANTVAMLEERRPSLYEEDTKSTWKVFNKHLENWKQPVDQRSFLRARMLDILLADFDRHYDQWKWGERDSAGEEVYYAIPKDRDQALYRSDGLLMKGVSLRFLPYLKGLRRDIPSVSMMGYVSRDIDAFFLNGLTRQDWEAELRSLQAALTDASIDSALRLLPPEVYALRGPDIADKLRARRDLLVRRGLDYYNFLATAVSVPGSNKDERFEIARDGDGVRLEVYRKAGDSRPAQLRYSRVFDPRETKEVRLYGLGGADYFHIADDVPRGIRFRIVGGDGRDSFLLRGRAKSFLYDEAGGKNVVLGAHRTTDMRSRRPDVNDYAFRENNYPGARIPTVAFGFNPDDGVLAGLGAIITRRGFRNNPYTTRHQINTLFSITRKAYDLRYRGEFNDIYRHFDLVASAGFTNPTLNNFFGFGNESVRDKSKNILYYQARYTSLDASLQLRHRFFERKMHIAAGPLLSYYRNRPDRNEGHVLDFPIAPELGVDSSSVSTPKWYAGGRLNFSFNSINNELLPTRGLRFFAGLTALKGISDSARDLLRAQADLSLYAPLSSNNRFIFALHSGGGHTFNGRPEFFQAFSLGANNYLRGYRKNRFTGSSMAYLSTELRARLFSFRSRVLPGELGLVGFHDVGRVWLQGEDSRKWHRSAGGGVYFTPFNSLLVSVLTGFSAEDAVVNLTVGANLNLTF